MSGKLYFWLCDYADEVSPSHPTLEAWSAWLAAPDPDWGRAEAAKDGDRFECSVSERWDAEAHWSTVYEKWIVTPDAPFDWCALTYGPGLGWDAESISEELAVMLEHCERDETHTVALMRDRPRITLEFRGGQLFEVV